MNDMGYDALEVGAIMMATDEACLNAYEFAKNLNDDFLEERVAFIGGIEKVSNDVKGGNSKAYTRSQLIALMLTFDHDHQLVGNCVTELKKRYIADEQESIIKRASCIQL